MKLVVFLHTGIWFEGQGIYTPQHNAMKEYGGCGGNSRNCRALALDVS
jgi:hypothetical protein